MKEQEDEAVDKRHMGLGITGLANAGEMMGLDYGSEKFLKWAERHHREVVAVPRMG